MRHLPRVFRIKSGQFFKLYPEFIPHHFSILYFWPVLNEETQSFQLRLFTHEKKTTTKKKCWMNQSKKISQIFVYHFPLNCLRDIETDDPVMRTIETVLFLEKLTQDAENKFFFLFSRSRRSHIRFPFLSFRRIFLSSSCNSHRNKAALRTKICQWEK